MVANHIEIWEHLIKHGIERKDGRKMKKEETKIIFYQLKNHNIFYSKKFLFSPIFLHENFV